MPFTLAHPAAILPLYRWSKARLPLSALIIGSMSPDLEKFVPGGFTAISHTARGLFYFCWPMGMAIWVVFLLLLKQPTIALMPDALRARMSSSATKLNPLLVFLASISVIIGAVTHVIWDSFTHRASPLVAILLSLQMVLTNIDGHPLRVYKLLQHVSTVLGLLVMTVWVFIVWKRAHQYTRTTEHQAHSMPPPTLSTAWRLVAIAAIAVSSCVGATIDYVFHAHLALEPRLSFLAVGGITAGALAWCAIAIVIVYKGQTTRT
jgi:large-conductance mechanosensitive channel